MVRFRVCVKFVLFSLFFFVVVFLLFVLVFYENLVCFNGLCIIYFLFFGDVTTFEYLNKIKYMYIAFPFSSYWSLLIIFGLYLLGFFS